MKKYVDYKDDVHFNRSGIFEFDNRIIVDMSLEGHNANKDSNTQMSKAEFKFVFNEDPDSSGWIEELLLKTTTTNGVSQIFEMTDIDPESLYWIGKELVKIAKYYGVDRKEVVRLNKKLLEEIL